MKRLIGYGYTNNKGIATLDYDKDGQAISPSGYTGNSRGLVDIQAVWHEDETIESNNLEITDCIQYDKGTQEDHNDIWSMSTTSSTCIVTRTNEYTEFKEASTQNNFANIVMGVTNSCIIEFDYWQLDGLTNTFMQIANASTQVTTGGMNLGMLNGNLETWYHLKLTIQNGVLTVVNETNGASFTKTINDTPIRFIFWSGGDVSTIRFKNFKIYPI